MSSIALSTHKPTPTIGIGDNMTDLIGWKHVGYYGSSLIYARDNKRRLVNPEIGQSFFEYTIANNGTDHSGHIEEAQAGEGDKNARL